MVRAIERRFGDLRLLAGHPCLDFLNTVDWRGREEPVEYLNTYREFVAWTEEVGLITPHQARGLGGVSRSSAVAALDRATAFREASYRALRALAQDRKPEARDLATMSAVIADARAHQTLRFVDGVLVWRASAEMDADAPLRAIALAFADLLVSHQRRNIRECGGYECGWLFLDTTKNHARRWCSMDGCGNRAKARRFYARMH